MSTRTIVRSAKVVGAITAGVLIAASVGSATAAPAAPTAAAPAAVTAETAPVAAVPVTAQPTSWRGSITETGVSAQAATIAPKRASRAVSARQALVAKQARFAHFTLRSKDTRDMRGVEPSLYRGTFYRSTIEAKRKCIVDRESEGHYDVVNPSGAYRGAYQVSAQLARGATWMMLKEHKKLMGSKTAKQTLAQLRTKPMNTWPRYWQDAAFHTVANWEHTGSGIAHWGGGRWHC
jgi:hypothetical protein